MKTINIEVDEEKHRMWKMMAARRGITLKEYITQSANHEIAPDIFGAVTSEKYTKGKK